MATAKQAELVAALMEQLNDGERAFCTPVIDGLLSLGYTPRRHKKSTFVVEFERGGRIIAKFEVQKGKDGSPALLFWLRFSACSGYPFIFEAAVRRRPEAWVKRNQEYVSFGPENCCGLCKGKPRFYRFTADDGGVVTRCGGYTLPVHGVTVGVVSEVMRMIGEQDTFFAELLTD